MKNNKSIKNFLIKENETIKRALFKMSNNMQGICFVTSNKKLKGFITEGDIRKKIVKGLSIKNKIAKIYNQNPKFFKYNTPKHLIVKSLNEKIRVIPLVNEKREIVDYASFYELKKTNLYNPSLSGNELKYLRDCISTNWISSQGKYVDLFEKKFRQILGFQNALSVSSGTTGLILALKALDLKKDDEIIVPNLTFAASVNAIVHAGARPVLVDIDPQDWNISVDLIKKAINKRTKGILCVHLFGLPCKMEELLKIKNKHKLFLIEDCAESIGSKYKNKNMGIFGDVSVFSFYGNKTITTGEGGMVVSKNKNLHKKMKILRDHGMDTKRKYWHNFIGYNFRMTNMQAAIGLGQLERFDKIIEKKINISKFYKKKLKPIENKIFYQKENFNIKNSYWLITIGIKNGSLKKTKKIMDFLSKNGIETRPMFYPSNIMPPYENFKFVKNKNISNSELISRSSICLPSSIDLTKKRIEFICKKIIQVTKKL